MDWSVINEALWGLVAGVLVALIVALGIIAKSFISYAQKWILAKIDKLSDETTKNAAQSAVATIDKLALSVVTSLEQEYAKAIRDSLAANDGKYTREDLVALHATAVTRIQETLSDEAKNAASTLISDLNGYINDKVSEIVYMIKSQDLITDGSDK